MVRLLAACLTPPRLCLVMELMETSLERMLYGGGPDQPLLPLGTVLDIALDVAQGLSECMKNGGRDMRVSYYGYMPLTDTRRPAFFTVGYLHPTIVHRDLKPG